MAEIKIDVIVDGIHLSEFDIISPTILSEVIHELEIKTADIEFQYRKKTK